MTGSFVILCILFCTFKNILLRRGPQASSEYTVQFMAQKITAHLVHQDLSLASLIQITTKKLEISFFPYILTNLSKLQWLKYIFIETAYCEIIKDFREFPGGQWLGLFALTSEGPVSILGWGTKIHKPYGRGVAKKEKHKSTYRSNITPK